MTMLTESELSFVQGQSIFRLNSSLQDSEDAIAEFDEFHECVSQFSERTSEIARFYTTCASPLDCSIATSTAHYPEEYVIEEPLYERLAYFSKMELSRTSTRRVDKHFLLFAQGGRRWRRVTVSATTRTLSGQSEPCFSFTEVGHRTFPSLVQSQLETMLETTPLYDSVTNIAIELELSEAGEVTFDDG